MAPGTKARAIAASTSPSLVAKTRKIVPSRDPGRLGDLTGGHLAAVLAQQPEGHVDQHLAALLGRP